MTTNSNANLFAVLDEGFDDLNLLQLVNFSTWSRIVGNTTRSSILDHIYVDNVELVKEITHLTPVFGDHELVMALLCIIKPQPKISFKRDWRRYTKDLLNDHLSRVDWTNNANNVQDVWNDFETKLVNVVDLLAPISEYHDNRLPSKPNPFIKRKFNIRNRLLKLW